MSAQALIEETQSYTAVQEPEMHKSHVMTCTRAIVNPFQASRPFFTIGKPEQNKPHCHNVQQHIFIVTSDPAQIKEPK